jgi:hypothetical protein
MGRAHGPIGDLASAEALDALGGPGCPLCRVIARQERRYLDAFWPAARTDPRLQARFRDAGGFCARHAWMLHGRVASHQGASAAAALYGRLVERDLSALAEGLAALDRPRRRLRGGPSLARVGRCLACVDTEAALARKAAFLVVILADDQARERYLASDGPCVPHLAALVREAHAEDDDTARFLLEDGRRRLARLRETVDGRAPADLPPVGEGCPTPWTRAIRRYAGEPPPSVDHAP